MGLVNRGRTARPSVQNDKARNSPAKDRFSRLVSERSFFAIDFLFATVEFLLAAFTNRVNKFIAIRPLHLPNYAGSRLHDQCGENVPYVNYERERARKMICLFVISSFRIINNCHIFWRLPARLLASLFSILRCHTSTVRAAVLKFHRRRGGCARIRARDTISSARPRGNANGERLNRILVWKRGDIPSGRF